MITTNEFMAYNQHVLEVSYGNNNVLETIHQRPLPPESWGSLFLQNMSARHILRLLAPEHVSGNSHTYLQEASHNSYNGLE